MAAIYTNALSGTITDAPLGVSATTINSSGFAYLPAVAAPDFMWITLDPTGVGGLPEIVKITAHTASATAATVVRYAQTAAGLLAPSGRTHAAGTVWRHSATKADWDGVLAATPAGTLRAGINAAADAGWLLMNQAVTNAQTLYPVLWTVAPAGWKSGSTLNLPDLTDRMLEGAGTTTLGVLGGANAVSIGVNNLPAHVHKAGNNVGAPSGSSQGVRSSDAGGNLDTDPNVTTHADLGVTNAHLAVVWQIKAH